MTKEFECRKCKADLIDDIYEYRGAYSCLEHFDEVIAMRDRERNEIIAEEKSKTETLSGLDFGDSVVGRQNRKLLKAHLEIASKESIRLKSYERGE